MVGLRGWVGGWVGCGGIQEVVGSRGGGGPGVGRGGGAVGGWIGVVGIQGVGGDPGGGSV